MVGETAHENFQWIDNKKYTIMEFKTLHFQNSINRKCPRAIIFFPSRSRQPTNFSFNSFFFFVLRSTSSKRPKAAGFDWTRALWRAQHGRNKNIGGSTIVAVNHPGPTFLSQEVNCYPLFFSPINPSLSLHRPLAQGSSFTEGQHHDTYTPHRDQITYTQTPRRSIRRERVSQKGRLLFLFF